MSKKKQNSGIDWLLRFIAGILCLGVLAEAVLWITKNVHPDSSVATSSSVQARYDFGNQLDILENNAKSDALSDLTYIEKIVHYSIPESDLIAPAPDSSCYGSTDDPAVITDLISSYPLAEGQSLAWNPDADFFPGQAFEYYRDDTLLVVCWKEVINSKCCSCAEVFTADGSQIRRKIADDTYGSSVQLYASDMAESANAVFAINGDFYAFRDLGITVYQRQVYRCNPASVDSCYFTADGDMLFSYAGELSDKAAAQQFVDDNDVVFGIAFGPILIDNGELRTISSYPIGEITGQYSRSCIGMLGERHYFLMTMNEEGSCTARGTVNELGQNMYNKGCIKAYTLDGGQTSVMVFNGTAFNRVDWGYERTMSDIIYFATAIPSGED